VQHLWHARLGHLSGRGITALARNGITDLPPTQCVLPFCKTCATIKSTVAPRLRGLHSKPTEPFERFGWDLWQNNTISLKGNSYSCGAIDYASSTVALYFCRSRSSSTACLRVSRTMGSALGFRLQLVRLENDSTSRSQDFIVACDESSTAREYAAPYIQYQNGLIERTWYTLSTWASCMLDYECLGAEFGEFAMAVAVHIHCTFRRGVNDIPLRMITSATPDLSYLRTFGCPAFVHVPRANRSKIAPFTREGIFVGYSPDSPAWLVWMPDTRIVLASRNVAFNEIDRLGRFDPTVPDEWHASPQQDCIVSSPSRVIPPSPSSSAP
jgi:hypothetical protein